MDGDASGVEPDGIHVPGHLREEDRYAMLDALESRTVTAHQEMTWLSGQIDPASSQDTNRTATSMRPRTGASVR